MTTIAVVGLGYVGLPLAVEFGKTYPTVGFDLSEAKVKAYCGFNDPTGEVSSADLRAATHLRCTTDPSVLKSADFIVIAVPTPVDDAHSPDFGPLVSSSRDRRRPPEARRCGRLRIDRLPRGNRGDLRADPRRALRGSNGSVTSSSATRPERINPGDKERTLTKIVKVVSGDTPRDTDQGGGDVRLRSSRPASIRPAASRSPRRRRSSRTRSAT